MVEKITIGRQVLEIIPDECAQNPREWSNVGKFVLFHKEYNLANETDIKFGREEVIDGNELIKRLKSEYHAEVILPVYMLDHSGVWLSTGPDCFAAMDPHGWDWGVIGFIFASRESILDNFTGYKGQERLPMKKRITKKMRSKTVEILKGEVSVYGKYLNGEVFGYRLSKLRTFRSGNIKLVKPVEIESCYGYFELEDIVTEVPKKFKKRLLKREFD